MDQSLAILGFAFLTFALAGFVKGVIGLLLLGGHLVVHALV